ncbi:hypothetical protein SRHO_G00125030 [Serrasalmus rhombeus]
MDPAVMIVLLLYSIDSVQALRHSEPLVISAEAGEAVNLTWTFVDNSIKEVMMCYKQRLEHAPLEVGSQLEGKSAVISDQLDKSRFKLNRIASGISLSIERVTKEDEGMYFCVESGKKTLDFSTATFLAVTGRDRDSVVENKASQNSAAVGLSYAAKSLRMKSGRSGHSVYSEVRYFSVTDPNNH